MRLGLLDKFNIIKSDLIIKNKELIPVVTFLTPLRLQINQDFQ